MATKITDHSDRALARLQEQDKGLTNTEALLGALVLPTQALEDAWIQLLLERTVDAAVGVQLDQLGLIVGQPRNGFGDDDYRRTIRARITANKSNGRLSEVATVSTLVVDDPLATFTYEPQWPAAIVVKISGITLDPFVANILIGLLRDTAAAGVRILLESTSGDDANTFTMALATFADGAISALDTTITVDSTAGFDATGSLTLSPGEAVEEDVTYTILNATQFTTSAAANAHVDNAAIVRSDGPGKGFGSFYDSNLGGKFASAGDTFDPALEPSEVIDLSLYNLEQTLVVESDVDTHTITLADPATIVEVLVEYWITHAESPTARDFKVYPRGVQGDDTGCAIVSNVGGFGSNLIRDDLTIAAGTSRERLQGRFILHADRTPAGTPDVGRRYEAFTTVFDDPVLSATSGYHRANGGWGNLVDTLDTIDIVGTTSASTTKQAAIGADSVFKVWVRRE